MSKNPANGRPLKGKSLLDKAKDKIFFEKQEGRLCGQHCLNNALQYRMFDAVDLSTIAQGLDEVERRTMAERGTNTQEYLDFIGKPSSNFDDSGYFSIQVLTQALKNVNLDLINWKSDDGRAVEAIKNPARERLFICHMDDHWLALRRFGPQWINLNSNLKQPELLTDSYLSIYLQTMQSEGYTIYAVFGELPECEAEDAFKTLRRNEDGKYTDQLVDPGHRLGSAPLCSDKALLVSSVVPVTAAPDAGKVRQQREQFLKRFMANSTTPALSNSSSSNSSLVSEKESETTRPSGNM